MWTVTAASRSGTSSKCGRAAPDYAIVAVNDEEYQMGEAFEVGGYRLEYFDTAGGRSLYRFVQE